MDEDLFLSIAAMDAYYRNNPNSQLQISGNQIGNAVVVRTSPPSSSGFSAVQYSVVGDGVGALEAGTPIIAYRGTDQIVDIRSWVTIFSNPNAPQIEEAIDFYRSADDLTSSPIVLTGHSLGGALAGMVGALFQEEAVLIANISFEATTNRIYSEQTYGDKTPWSPNFAGIRTYAVAGEVAESTRLVQNTPVTTIPFPTITGPLWDWELHAADIHVILLYSHLFQASMRNWEDAIDPLFEALTSVRVGESAGFADATSLSSAIAYSALSEGERPFGDTAIRAMFDDAADLSVGVSATASSAVRESESLIGEVLVENAGRLAFGAVLVEDDPQAASGILSLAESGSALTINLSDAAWTKDGLVNKPDVLEELILTSVEEGGGLAEFAWKALTWLSDTTGEAAGHIVDIVDALSYQIEIGAPDELSFTDANSILVFVMGQFAGVEQHLTSPGNSKNFIIGSSAGEGIDARDGVDVLLGNGGNDKLEGGGGSDWIHGGDGHDQAIYDGSEASITVRFDGSGNSPSLTVLDGSGGTDTLLSIEEIVATQYNDSFSFIGSLPNEYDLKIDAAGGQQHSDLIDLQAATAQLQAKITEGGVELTSPGSSGRIELSGFHTTVSGSDTAKTIFIGAGTGAEFRAGAAGGDFTLLAGDKAYGHEGAVDVFRVTTTVPEEFASLSEAEKVAYLTRNKVFIGKFGTEDQIYVNDLLFDGNKLSSTLMQAWSDHPNDDVRFGEVNLSGQSSYGTVYLQSYFVEWGTTVTGAPYGRYVADPGPVRHVSYSLVDNSGLGLISFSSTDMAGAGLPSLSSADERLTILIDGFTDGEGGISFQADALANVIAEPPEGFWWTNTPELGFWPYGDYRDKGNVLWVGTADFLDGNPDGFITGGGTKIDSAHPMYNLGPRLWDDTGFDWEAYMMPPQVMDGGAGDDSFEGGWADDVLGGVGGNDTLAGGPGNDRLSGGDGDDRLVGDYGDDFLQGGDGDDVLIAGWGNDIVDGGPGVDIAHVFDSSSNVRLYRDEEGTVLSASAYSTTEVTRFMNVEALYFEDDGVTISLADLAGGTSGDDILSGTEGYDTYDAGQGNDVLYGLGGDDWLFGGAGDDVLTGGEHYDLLDGGTGFDIAHFAGNIDDYLIALGEDGTLTVADFWNSDGEDTLSAIERLVFDGDGSVVDLLSAPQLGTGEDDDIEGSAGADLVLGFTGNDVLSGGAGDDSLRGGDGEDQLRGDEGHDVLYGGRGDDQFDGGAGDDTIVYRLGEGSDSIVPGEGWDVLRLAGLYSADVMFWTGGGGSNDIVLAFPYPGSTVAIRGGAATADSIDMIEFEDGSSWTRAQLIDRYLAAQISDGPDNVTGTSGADTIDALGGNDVVEGLAGNDTLAGGAGNDALYGGEGDDLLDGGAGNDQLDGGAGDDLFQYSALGGGFDAVAGGDGYDGIVATGINAWIGLSSLSGVEAIGSGGFAGVAYRVPPRQTPSTSVV
ncbi:DUF2974 domain-containing protein [Sphingomonas parva]|uniref:DUF2974 domain-containing protein n=1 Tax=Sphingomonas parva TaxID=2555898 RepID=A0A4Y8ZKE2_9SPHN|nr:Mbeg1-like protein [Sphingomonas parva]TFI56471.1 DUF2974 domain-containing protein [Sphingomonas parva]